MFAGWENLTPGKRYGHAVPRIFTPPLRVLVPEVVDSFGRIVREATTWGYEVITYARDVLGVDLDPWQKWLLIHMLEVGEDGLLRFATAVVLVARQNGKSTLSQVLALWFMHAAGWPLVLGTAQDLGTAEEVWEGALGLLEDDEELSAEVLGKKSLVNGNKWFALKSGERYKVKAANRRAGRGLSGNLIILDELREQQNWAAWGAITKTRNAQKYSLVLTLSNAGDITSVVLRHLRKMAHAALGDPDGINGAAVMDALVTSGPSDLDAEETDVEVDDLEDDPDTLFIAEWSAKPGLPVKDRDGWQQSNPSLGYRMQERNIASDVKTDPEWVFRTEVLCQWSDATLDGPFPAGAWEQGRNPIVLDDDGVPVLGPSGQVQLADAAGRPVVPDRAGRTMYSLVGKVDVGIDQSSDRSTTWVAVHGRRPDGREQVIITTARPGTDWVAEYLMTDPTLRGRIRRVTGQGRGAPISGLVASLAADPKFTIPVVPLAGGELMDAAGLTFDTVRDVEVFHNPQEPLDLAAATATMKQLGNGGGFVIDRTASQFDVAPLQAFSGALWLGRQPFTDNTTPPPDLIAVTATGRTDTDPLPGRGSTSEEVDVATVEW